MTRPKTGGRTPGTPNRMSRSLRDMILKALTKAGGISYLARVAKAEPKAFCTLLAKLLPTQLTAEDYEPLMDRAPTALDIARRIAFILAAGAHTEAAHSEEPQYPGDQPNTVNVPDRSGHPLDKATVQGKGR